MTGRWVWHGIGGRRASDAEAGSPAGEGWPEQRPPGEANGTPGRLRTAAAGRLPWEPPVPSLLQRAAAWSWRLLVVGILIYVLFRVASALRLVVLPCIAALLLTALLQPLTERLRRAGMPSLES